MTYVLKTIQPIIQPILDAISGKERFQISTDPSGITTNIIGNFKSSTDSSGVNTDASGISQTSSVNLALSWTFRILGYIVCLVLAMIVANNLIMHPWQIRLFGFLFTLFMTIVNPIAFFIVIIYYIFFALSRIYYNSTLKKEDPNYKILKRALLPSLFTMCPITTNVSENSALRVLLYPFTYNVEETRERLEDERNIIVDSVERSYPNFKETNKIGGFTELFSKYVKSLSDMHTEIKKTGTGSETEPENNK